MLRSIEALRSYRLIFECNSKVIILPKADARLKCTTEWSVWKTFELSLSSKLSNNYYNYKDKNDNLISFSL